MTIIRNIINHLTENPKTLFIIDGLGAMLTAILLLVVVRNFNEYFGMPKTILTYLSAIAACFAIFSTSCFLLVKQNRLPFIRSISYANLLYCILILILLIMYCYQLTIMGIIYFIVEIIIISVLAYIELNVATAIKKKIIY